MALMTGPGLSLPLPADLEPVRATLLQGGRLSVEEAERLWSHPDLLAVAGLADEVAIRRWGHAVTYSCPVRVPLDRLCPAPCRVCDPAWGEGAPTAGRLLEALGPARPGEIHLLGTGGREAAGMESLVRCLREAFPEAWIQGFVSGDLLDLARRSATSPAGVAGRLQQAGLDAMLGSEEEVYTCQGRILWRGHSSPGEAEALATQGEAHSVGLPSQATVVYDAQDGPAGIVARLEAVRIQQRKSAGFSLLAPLPRMLDERFGPPAPGYEDVRCVSVARLLLDNVSRIRIPWMALGLKMGQVGLRFGADDVGWAATDPHVHAFAPPTAFMALGEDALRRAIGAAGREPRRVDGSGRSVGDDARAGARPAGRPSDRRRDDG